MTSFVGSFFKYLSGNAPTQAQEKVFNAVLLSCQQYISTSEVDFDQDIKITEAMQLFDCLQKHEDIEQAACTLVKGARKEQKQFIGFISNSQRRSDTDILQLFSLARSQGLSTEYMDIAFAVETLLEAEMLSKHTLDMQGAVAALLLTLGLKPEAGNAVFTLARAAVSAANVVEEKKSS